MGIYDESCPHRHGRLCLGRIEEDKCPDDCKFKVPNNCPITGLAFFTSIVHPIRGWVPTYGGPYDSYTIPEQDEDGEYYRERYCHDRDEWMGTEYVDVTA